MGLKLTIIACLICSSTQQKLCSECVNVKLFCVFCVSWRILSTLCCTTSNPVYVCVSVWSIQRVVDIVGDVLCVSAEREKMSVYLDARI